MLEILFEWNKIRIELNCGQNDSCNLRQCLGQRKWTDKSSSNAFCVYFDAIARVVLWIKCGERSCFYINLKSNCNQFSSWQYVTQNHILSDCLDEKFLMKLFSNNCFHELHWTIAVHSIFGWCFEKVPTSSQQPKRKYLRFKCEHVCRPVKYLVYVRMRILNSIRQKHITHFTWILQHVQIYNKV